MKVIQRGIMKILPGKIEEAMKLLEEWFAMVKLLGVPVEKMRSYRPVSGGNDIMHTQIFEIEWNSFTEMATFFDKVMAGPEFQTEMAKWDAIIETHEMEILTPMS